MSFDCKKCGKCCSHVGMALPNWKYGLDKSGRCNMLTTDNLCKIYKNRPDECNVDKAYNKYFKEQMSREDFYKENLEKCNNFDNWLDSIVRKDQLCLQQS